MENEKMKGANMIISKTEIDDLDFLNDLLKNAKINMALYYSSKGSRIGLKDYDRSIKLRSETNIMNFILTKCGLENNCHTSKQKEKLEQIYKKYNIPIPKIKIEVTNKVKGAKKNGKSKNSSSKTKQRAVCRRN